MERDLMDRRPLRREYSEDFKAEVLAQTREAGASVSGVALSHGLHPNMVQRWRREERQRQAAPAQQNIDQAFVPLRLAPVCNPSPEVAEAPVPVVETIRMELTRAGATLTVHWPVSAAGQCAQMLRDLLR
jgi:transposase-like protein